MYLFVPVYNLCAGLCGYVFTPVVCTQRKTRILAILSVNLPPHGRKTLASLKIVEANL